MIIFLVCLIIFSAFLYLLFAIYYKIQLAKFILKPGTMVLIIILAIYGSQLDTNFSKWVVIALFFSLIGDVFLMLKEKWFIHGLTSFLIAHLVYIVGFWYSFDPKINTITSMLTGAFLFVLATCFFFILIPSIKVRGGTKLTIAVASYISVISMMVWSAVLIDGKILIAAALLFYISDAVLAFNKFKNSFISAEYIVMFTYFFAQLLFSLSIG